MSASARTPSRTSVKSRSTSRLPTASRGSAIPRRIARARRQKLGSTNTGRCPGPTSGKSRATTTRTPSAVPTPRATTSWAALVAPYTLVGRSGVRSCIGPPPPPPYESAEPATTTVCTAAGARATASTRFSVPAPFTARASRDRLPASAPDEKPARWKIRRGRAAFTAEATASASRTSSRVQAAAARPAGERVPPEGTSPSIVAVTS